ncbi:MAG: hypothetical protein IJS93_02990 [Clostridia bacterium]|nr:hypothetical protein [Clostridia bacterium]
MSRADIILKLKVGKDKRTVAPVETGGHISYFFRTFTGKMKDMLKFSLLYAAIFALPLLFSAFGLPILLKKLVFTGKSFIANIGIGFPGVADNLNDSLAQLYYDYRIILFPALIGSIFIAFAGLSGLFHCARGLMWGETVKTKSFFRGIKRLWKPFLITGLVVSAISAGVIYGMGWHLELLATTGANAGSWIVFILCLLVILLEVCVLIVLLPTFACYDFTFGEALGNAFKFLAIMPIPNLIIAIISAGIVALVAISDVMAIIIGGLLLMMGFMFFATMWTTYGQYLFDSFIVPQVDADGNRRPDIVKKLQAKKEAKNAAEGKGKTAPVQNAEPKNRAATRTPKNQNTYNSSYKRKNDNSKNNGNNKKK